MQFQTPRNGSYSAVIVRIDDTHALDRLDNLVGVNVLGHQALTGKDIQPGELHVAFTAETALSEEYARENNLHRDVELNKTNETGYLEANRRVKAIRFRGNQSDALLMPLSSLAYTGIDITKLEAGDQFDIIGDHEICRKYEIPVKASSVAGNKVRKAFRRVDNHIFPEHISTTQFHRGYDDINRRGGEVVMTAKLHGTSIRVGRVPVLRKKGFFENLLGKLIPTTDRELSMVYGSHHAIKDVSNPNQKHYYSEDVYTLHGKRLDGLIPDNVIIYGELIGWTSDNKQIQKGYTYHLPRGEAELFVYRVAVVNAEDSVMDLSWDGVKQFCAQRGLKWVPEIGRIPADYFDNREATEAGVAKYMNVCFFDEYVAGRLPFAERPLPLSDNGTVDEGVCLRQDGIIPTLLKEKASEFRVYESKQIDTGVPDLESVS